MEIWKYEDTDLNKIVDRVPVKERDEVPYGVIELDKMGNILSYNMAEAAISGLKPSDVIGKNFFLDVAECTQRPEFFGKFKEGVDKKFLNHIFDFTFDANMEPTRVRVHMAYISDRVWLMVKRVSLDGKVVSKLVDMPKDVPAEAPTPSVSEVAERTRAAVASARKEKLDKLGMEEFTLG
jgi:photoactive yellow protein